MKENFYNNFLNKVPRKDIIDLSTGNPQIFPDITDIVKLSLIKITKDSSVPEGLAKYEHYFGLPVFLKIIQNNFSGFFKIKILIEQIIVTPGVQNTLRYIHNIAENNNKKIFLPFKLEFPGAFPFDSGLLIEECFDAFIDDYGNYNPIINKKIDWKNIGFTIISNPHNPTSTYFKESFIKYLNQKMSEVGGYLVIDHTYNFPLASLTSKKNDMSIYNLPNIINLYSFSKIGLAAERISFVVADQSIINQIKIQVLKNIIQVPKIGQLLAAELFLNIKKNKKIQVNLRNWYNKQWSYASNVLIKNLSIPNLIRIVSRGGGPFMYFELAMQIDIDHLKKQCAEDGLLITTNYDLLPDYMMSGVRNGIRIGLSCDKKDIKKGMNILVKNIKIQYQELN